MTSGIKSTAYYATGAILKGLGESSNICSKLFFTVGLAELIGQRLSKIMIPEKICNTATNQCSILTFHEYYRIGPESLGWGIALHLCALVAKALSASAFEQSNRLAKAKIKKAS